MLKICMMTDNQQVIQTTKTLLEENQVNYQIQNEYTKDINLAIGNASQLKNISQMVMMIVFMDSHDYDDILAKNGLCAIIEMDDIEKQFLQSFNDFLDYYFENYHYKVSTTEDFFLDEVLYFHFPTFNDIEVYTKEKTYQYKVNNTQIYSQILPMNFISSGKEYMVNCDYLDLINESIKQNVQMKHVEDRKVRFELSEGETISTGNTLTKKQIKSGKRNLFACLLIISLIFAFNMHRANMPIYYGAILTLIAVCGLYPILLPSVLKLTQTYYELRDDGIYFFDCFKLKEKLQWISAIEKGTHENIMTHIPFEEIAYLRLKTRSTLSMIGARMMYVDMKNYHLQMIVETKTDTLEFNEVNLFGESVKGQMQVQKTLTSFINKIRLKNINIQQNENFAFVLNDPNATLSQYFNKNRKSEE